MTTILQTDGLTKRFGGLVAVDNLDLRIERGEIAGLIGPNGSGKTTAFNLITGFLKPDTGHIEYNGHSITGESPYEIASRGLGRTFQRTKPFGKLTVLENMLVPITKGLTGEAKETRAREILDELDLTPVIGNRGEDLSGGQKKLLEIARVLMLDPDLIMLDEPSAGVNPVLMDDILDNIKRLNETGRTIILIEHDMTVIEGLSDRVIVMHNGRKITSGTFEEVQQNSLVRDAYLGGQQ
ncbi:ABC transporter ATP-binding protein [Haladaptatus halobius]|uniref:ABC transporter ATP-binding protein n=1 Tax=Haladaptatus halobius TaxID=2884875 RepID=UPI001D0ADC6D|nr:ABC transporter ATP-binding protein [Haladaptatus halobius]